jgi:hypothetical protein
MKFVHLNKDGSRNKRVRYQIKIAGQWETVKKGQPQFSGWLHWEDAEGCIGLAKPENWRIKPPRDTEELFNEGRLMLTAPKEWRNGE